MENNNTAILQEIQELKVLLAKLIGTADREVAERFSEAALDKAAKDFLKISIERGEWVKEEDLHRYLGPCSWHAGAFIQKEFAFANWIKRGRDYLYAKKDLIALGQELKARNVNLKRYQEFLVEKAAFDKKAALKTAPVKKPNGKPYMFPKGVKNITTSDIPKPDPELVRQDLLRLKQEFKAGKFDAYIDIYRGTHAMMKFIYVFEKYLEPGLKRRCRKWCEDFNYAHHALELLTGKKDKFVISDPTAIEL